MRQRQLGRAGKRASGSGRRRRLSGFAVGLTAFVLLAIPAVALANLSWSTPVGIDDNGGQPMSAIACPSTTQCSAVDIASQEVTFNPAAATPTPADLPLAGGNSLNSVVCPATTECVALDGAAESEITFNPVAHTASTPEQIDTHAVSNVSCFSTTQCVAVDDSGNEVMFNPLDVPTPPTAEPIGTDSYTSSYPPEDPFVSCPSATQCTAVDYTGGEVTFNPTTGAVSTTDATLDTFNGNSADNAYFGIECLSTTMCVAVDGGGYETTFDPTDPTSVVTTSDFRVDTNGLTGISCPSATQCVAVGNNGSVASFDPATPNGNFDIIGSGTNDTLESVSCAPTSTQCTAVDALGHEFTFAAATPGNPTAVTIDPSNSLYDVMCPTSTECVAVDGAGNEITFNPADTAGAATHLIDAGATLYGVSCTSSTECSAVDRNGDQVTFDPTSGTVDNSGLIDSVTTLNHIVCIAAGNLCSAVDGSGQEVTFTPSNGTVTVAAHTIDSGHPLNSESCPTATECSAVDGAGGEVTYNPATGTPTGSVTTIDGTQPLYSLSCSSTASCTAGDNNGGVVSYDPLTAQVTEPVTRVDSGNFVLAINCPATNLCVAVDQLDDSVQGDPADPSAWTTNTITGMDTMNGLSCPSTAMCVTIDLVGQVSVATSGGATPVPVDSTVPTISGSAAQGQSLTLTHGTWTNSPTGYTDQWEDCNSSGTGCSAISGAVGTSHLLTSSDVGHTIEVSEYASNGSGPGVAVSSAATAVVASSSTSGGGGTSPAGAPVNSGLPTIAGTDVAGHTLSESHGTWSGSPTAYSYQWERCDSSASGCVAIAGATGQTYTLSSADVGSTIRVVETASNGYGASGPSASIATLQIQPAASSSKVAAPNTKLLKHKISSKGHSATFHFSATGKVTAFRCALVREPTRKGAKAPKPKYVACGTAKTYSHLKAGRYELYVRAVGPGGTDKTPATLRFTIK